MTILKCDDHFRAQLAQLLVALLTFRTCLGWSTPTVLIGLLRSTLLGITLMSYVILFLKAHKQ